ncbi:MAG: alpha-amylase family glycosyl hydrolase [Gemmatimonadales bacterium]
MPTLIEPTPPTRLADADTTPRGPVHPSPVDWRDQTLYFLLPDRFSDGREAERPLFDRGRRDEHRAPDRAAWMQAGRAFQGGTLSGVRSRLDYLRDLGMSTLWVGPVWRQRADLQTYHGYGIQNFLDVDPRFGTRQDLRDLVDAAHGRGMYVVLDVIYNHTGNNWFYDLDRAPQAQVPYRFSPPHGMHGWRAANSASTPVIQTLDDGVWPQELQDPAWYTRAGAIGRWDPEPWEDPLHPDAEFRRGDFFDLKDLRMDRDDVLSALLRAYQYWIALSDCDGFRIDTVKHVSFEASRNFCGSIHEYAESIGKENFLLLGEVTGGTRMARDYLEIFGRNLDAVLDIGDPAGRLTDLAKGLRQPADFFDLFRGHDILGTHRETGRYHISVLDDHDMVGRSKHRFAAHNEIPALNAQVAHAVGVQLTTLGIPCVYYGTEQSFDGSEASHDPAVDPGFEDRFIRESMFGGSFGAFGTAGCHFFDTAHPTYRRIRAIGRVRNRDDSIGLALRRGRQYVREMSFDDRPFAVPGRGELVAWSRILYDREVLIALNTNGAASRGAEVTVDAALQRDRQALTILYRGDWSDQEMETPPNDQTVPIQSRAGRTTVRIDLPPAGMAILA